MPIITPSQIKNHLSQILHKHPDARIIGLKSPFQWPDDAVVEIDEHRLRVRPCHSQLAIREAVADAHEAGSRLAFVTDLEDADLGDDLRARLTRRRLLPIRPWESVKALFRAREIDGSLFKTPWIADVLINQAPADGYAVAVNGFLTARRVWQEVLALELDLPSARPDAADIIEWSCHANHITRLSSMDEGHLEDICQWLDQGVDSLEARLLECLKADPSLNLLALGLVFEVINADVDRGRGRLRDAAIRLEKYTGSQPFPREWALRLQDAALRVYQALRSNGSTEMIASAQAATDQLLMQSGVSEMAWLSRASLQGFEQRRIRFAQSAKDWLEKGGQTLERQCIERLEQVERHWEAPQFERQCEQMRMAVRLIRWLGLETRPAPSFSQAARDYVKEGGFVDRAREKIRSGDAREAINQLYILLMERVERVRDRQNQTFAALLKEWTAAGSESEDLIKIEDLLAQQAAPIAQKQRLLVIVMDGMNQAVFTEIKEDMIRRHGWVELAAADGAPQAPVIAALPTTTEASRRALLCGKLTPDANEESGFAAHPELRAASGGLPPILLRKSALGGSGGAFLAKAARKEIHRAKRRVVGVVVNSVDDYLDRGDQVSFAWRLEHLHLLAQLLDEARDAGRIVMICSDHGHTPDYHSKRLTGDGGQRWRADDGSLKEGEILMQGSRVLIADTHRMIAPVSEHARYGNKKNGYHGGVAPQEVVAPWAVMRWREAGPGRKAAPLRQPDWWRLHDQNKSATASVKAPEPPIEEPEGQLPLFP